MTDTDDKANARESVDAPRPAAAGGKSRASFVARRGADAALAAVVVVGLLSVFLISRRLEAERPPEDPFASYEEMYVTPEAARRLSLSFNGLVADWYWMRALQYLGRKSAAFRGDFTLDDLRPLGVRNLGPLLEQATTLDPQFMAAYEFGAVVLPSVDGDAAVRLVEKGIRENPERWRLRQHLGYIHWQAGRFQEAAEAYRAGSRLAGAPAWMEAMAAQVEVYGGSRETARVLYRRMHADSTDEQIRTLALKRLLQIDSLDERDRVRGVLREFQARAARCPASWREVSAALRANRLRLDATGAPLDPTDAPYVLDAATCDVRLNERSEIPKR